MAKLDASVTVLVEKIYADAFKQMAKELAANHGLYLTDISFDWEYMAMGTQGKVLHKVRVTTESH